MILLHKLWNHNKKHVINGKVKQQSFCAKYQKPVPAAHLAEVKFA